MIRFTVALKRLFYFSAVVSLVVASSCAGKKTNPDSTPGDTNAATNAPAADENTLGDSDSGKAMGLQTVHYPFDSFSLDSEAKSVLKSNAQILKDKASLKIQIEGHCDQKGGIQYNIALGEKRANAAKNYLVDQGVPADRITTISYGKERPVDTGTTEEAQAKNRRSNFVVTAR